MTKRNIAKAGIPKWCGKDFHSEGLDLLFHTQKQTHGDGAALEGRSGPFTFRPTSRRGIEPALQIQTLPPVSPP